MAEQFLPVDPLEGGVTRPKGIGNLVSPVSSQVAGRTSNTPEPQTGTMVPLQTGQASQSQREATPRGTNQMPDLQAQQQTGGAPEDDQVWDQVIGGLSEPGVSQALLAAGSAMLQGGPNTAQNLGAGVQAGLSAFQQAREQQSVQERREEQTEQQERRLDLTEEQQEATREQRDQELRQQARRLNIQEDTQEFEELSSLRQYRLDERLVELRERGEQLERMSGSANSKQAGIASLVLDSWVASGQISPDERSMFMTDALEVGRQYFQDENTQDMVNNMTEAYVENQMGTALPGEEPPDPSEVSRQAEAFRNQLTRSISGGQQGEQNEALTGGLSQQRIQQRRGDAAIRNQLRNLDSSWDELAEETRTRVRSAVRRRYPEWDASQWGTGQ